MWICAMPMLLLEAAIELLAKYQSELKIRDIHLSLAPNGDVEVSVVTPECTGAINAPYGRIDRRTGHLKRVAALN
jgi:hypothetical protein